MAFPLVFLQLSLDLRRELSIIVHTTIQYCYTVTIILMLLKCSQSCIIITVQQYCMKRMKTWIFQQCLKTLMNSDQCLESRLMTLHVMCYTYPHHLCTVQYSSLFWPHPLSAQSTFICWYLQVLLYVQMLCSRLQLSKIKIYIQSKNQVIDASRNQILAFQM